MSLEILATLCDYLQSRGVDASLSPSGLAVNVPGHGFVFLGVA